MTLSEFFTWFIEEFDFECVVRCKDCKFFEGGYCWFFDSVVDADGFCYKAKKEGDEE